VLQRRLFRKLHPPVGARPGTLVVDSGSPAPRIRVTTYAEEGVEERDVLDPNQLRSVVASGAKTWIDVQGLGDEAVLRGISAAFGIHPLVIEDVVNVPQRPKAESYPEYQLFIVRMVEPLSDGAANVEQVSLLLGRTWVLTFEERPGLAFDPVRRRLHEGTGPMRRLGPDYLAYALLDSIVDAYYPLLQRLGDEIEELEDEVMGAAPPGTLERVVEIRKTLLQVRRAVWPLRDALAGVIKDGGPFLTEEVRVYLRDTYDHAAQAMDVTEAYREMVSGLFNTYLSVVSNRTNEIMRVLTVTASIFIPLTFMAGIYGMNFENMPELRVWWSYPALLALMLLVAGGLVLYFRRRGWIGAPRRRGRGQDRRAGP